MAETSAPVAGSAALQPFLFPDLAQRAVVVDFSGGHVSSDGGLLLLSQLDRSLGLTRRLSECFVDVRHPVWVEHSVRELVAQRVLGLAAGYEDLNDHDRLRTDPLVAVAVGKADPLGQDRRCVEDRGKALAGTSTLNRLELSNDKDTRYHKIQADHAQIRDLLIELAVRTLDPQTPEIVLDLDATDDPLHGNQEGRFFHGYYGDYCYLPLYIVCGRVPLWAQLRTSNQDACAGTVEALEQIIPALRKRCPQARIIVRADSGFCREEIMAWCEQQSPAVYYCLGLARNSRLEAALEGSLFWARAQACLTGGVARRFSEFEYQTRESWTRARRVMGKAEVLGGKDNPRFIVSNLPVDGFRPEEVGRFAPQACYEDFYCARGEMENRIKEQQLDLFGDRTSTHFMASNQLRLWFSTFAYLLMERLRAIGLQGTVLAQATAGTIRTRLLKIGALVRVSVRRVQVQLASAFPLQAVFARAYTALQAIVPATS
jgi:hypothetical protein